MILAFAALITAAPLQLIDGSSHSIPSWQDNIRLEHIYFAGKY